MNLDPRSLLSLELATLVLALLVMIITLRLRRVRRRGQRRVVELPNSHYTSQLARNSEKRHRWSNIALERLHEVNREEVVRLVAKVDATSVDALRPNERTFLDRMVEIAGTRPLPPSDDDVGPQPAPELRHRPA